ncbi:MAG: histidine triad nucleotide-binding protein [Alphaproteobacteria bacterium]|jgi:diadenosine tetraphosphate (Ap4A) HIT family hydrolase|nr:histidine triad nucleotide-binding protein [Rhodospirillaceae bacterium]MDP6022071.1 histidine triad nucleotide-binding protein [Alphaproteobacteria bacterium]MDP6255025.1 histidine triad nucleotide-binding protein [Alphaproteobacteria bacterium]MDP7053312.1 histidine triad nucleotide-binding protein [Alphaproteobacteria bacterium]MDP7228850.1 histidine triad nucleotide-binding protein [Alphaproteobacteria bacterium]|tara:strand:+ start:2915 stop:3283 length:369 start_codon:yes stop_codon:yes gene_type:complete
MAYDQNNIFARILRGEIPCKKVHENEHALAFHDINPQMPVHVLVIPKGPYANLAEFNAKASVEEMSAFMQAVAETAKMVGVEDSGYRLVANNGEDAHQEVPHFHMHIFGGRRIMGRMIKAQD